MGKFSSRLLLCICIASCCTKIIQSPQISSLGCLYWQLSLWTINLNIQMDSTECLHSGGVLALKEPRRREIYSCNTVMYTAYMATWKQRWFCSPCKVTTLMWCMLCCSQPGMASTRGGPHCHRTVLSRHLLLLLLLLLRQWDGRTVRQTSASTLVPQPRKFHGSQTLRTISYRTRTFRTLGDSNRDRQRRGGSRKCRWRDDGI